MMMRNAKWARVLIGYCLLQVSCVYNDLPNCDPNLTLQVVQQDPTDCAVQDGLIEVVLRGAEGNFRFRLDENAFQDEPVFSGLGAGDYTVTAVWGSCEYSVTASIANKSGFEANASTTPSGCATSNGSLTVETIGGVPPFMHQLEGSSFQTSNVFSNLASGSYKVITQDSEGCNFSQSVTIHSGTSFSEVFEILQANCAVSGCHNGGQFPTLTSFTVIHNNASRIRNQVVDRTMPPDDRLTQQEINAIVCWIDDGALQ